jgi:hypothetical protein
MHTRLADLIHCNIAIRQKSLRRCVLATLAVAALGWPNIGNAQTLSIKVVGNQLINQNNAVVRLHGVDFSGPEYACTGNGGDPNNELGYGIFDWPSQGSPPTITGPTPSVIAGLKTWHINAIRLPLNETCWNGTLQQSTSTFQAWASGTTLYVFNVNSGTVQTGASYPLSDVGGKLEAATYITGQQSGIAGGPGTYTLNNPQTIIQTSFTGSISGWSLVPNSTYQYTATLTVTQMSAGSDTIKSGLSLAGPNGEVVPGLYNGAYVSAFGSGTGGTGTYTVTVNTNSSTPPGNIASQTMYAGETMSQTDTSTAFPAIDPSYAGSIYQNAIASFVQDLTNAGIYVILDLHANAPDPVVAGNGWAMADSNHSNDFWFSVATTFKNNPAVIFDLFNEPHLSLGGETFNGAMFVGTATDWACWKNGCYIPSNSAGAYGWAFFTAGMQQLLNTVRATGATNTVMLGGCCDYAQDFSQWLTYLPTDETPAGYSGTWVPQIIASYHRYGGGQPFTTDQQDELQYVQTVGASYPVVAGEFGEYDCATSYVYPFMDFFDANGWSYLGWTWNDTACGTPALLALTNNSSRTNNDYYYPTPTAEGQGLDYHLQALYRQHDTHDFNGDGTSDIFWRDTSGNMSIWEMNGGTILNPSNSGLGSVPTTWSIVGQRDFNGDGKADILWHDTSGNLSIWEMNGTTILNPNNSGLGSVPTVWSIVGIGDFNGDGMADILWRNTSTGDLAIWEMNGTTILNPNSSGLGNVPLNWSVVGVGDFNGDGKADILWRNNTNGNVAIWLMNGITVTNSSTATFGNMPASWFVAGSGDFNGDGNSDILWQDSSGDIAIWEMNGTTILNPSVTGVGSLSTVWSVAQTGDFDGNGTSDILWRDTSGDLAIWYMNGTTISSGSGLGTMPTTWTIQGTNAD